MNKYNRWIREYGVWLQVPLPVPYLSLNILKNYFSNNIFVDYNMDFRKSLINWIRNISITKPLGPASNLTMIYGSIYFLYAHFLYNYSM